MVNNKNNMTLFERVQIHCTDHKHGSIFQIGYKVYKKLTLESWCMNVHFGENFNVIKKVGVS